MRVAYEIFLTSDFIYTRGGTYHVYVENTRESTYLLIILQT